MDVMKYFNVASFCFQPTDYSFGVPKEGDKVLEYNLGSVEVPSGGTLIFSG